MAASIKQAVLLAAGKGTRLLPATEHVPKCLVHISGRPLLDSLLEGLSHTDVEELVVVVGYKEQPLRDHLAAQALPFKVVVCPDYATTNNIVSLLAAAEAVKPPFMLLESDVYAEPTVYKRLMEPDTMLVSEYQEEMDGTGAAIGDGESIVGLQLAAHKSPEGVNRLKKTVNYCSLSRASWSEIERRVSQWVTEGRTGEYYEAVFAELLSEGKVSFSASDISSLRWKEIDDLIDLAAAERLTQFG